ncbi:anti-phage ZorAB system protein ZorA [Afifella sp. IM 167]|uniref:anti-phage ZorAB system protein ZorA n=1 Tax=Afifella sp. IM 167 TaxID=2033586 RepID=UPI001CC96853|nr:anti-phage ZorAB system protein ZorA [Afifella sp. IM 167]
MGSIVWNGGVRFLAFWLVVGAILVFLASWWPWLDASLVLAVFREAIDGNLERVSQPEFAYALAAGLGALAIALLTAFLLLHVVALRLALGRLRRAVMRTSGMVDFADQYETIDQRLSRSPLLRHAWKEFDETLVKPEPGSSEPIRNTVRPQTFFNISLARERLFGLKMMGSIPSYFVGTGLLLTFIGLVLALHTAAGGVSSPDADAMGIATRELLKVATFKFATSIAGLGASIVLSFAFRAYQISIESGFSAFCEGVEERLLYTAPQLISSQMNERIGAQLDELKQINSADFFARMGEAVSPQIQGAFTTAMAPVTQSLDQAVGRLTENSQSGVQELIARFTEGVQGSAGEELRELSSTLRQAQESLAATQRGISGTGEDFGRRMSEAAENLNRLVGEAGHRLEASAETNRTALAETVRALQESFERANQKVDEELARSAVGASSRLEEAMGRVMEKLESQITNLGTEMGGFQEASSRQLEESRQHLHAVQNEAAGAIHTAASGAAQALAAGIRESVARIHAEIERFATTMEAARNDFSAHGGAIRDATDKTRLISDAFSQTADDVRTASAPLARSGEAMASAAREMSSSVASTVSTLQAEHAAAERMSNELAAVLTQMKELWAGYANRFQSIDQELGQALNKIYEQSRAQGDSLAEYSTKVDQDLAKAASHLHTTLADLRDNTDELSEAVVALRNALMREAAE